MLARIDLRHFKCFDLLKLPLNRLTLLSGLNASGKSTVIQALTLLHQTMREHEWSSRLMLNGAVLRLGAASDVIDRIGGRDACAITLWPGEDDEHTGHSIEWRFEGQRDDMSLAVASIRIHSQGTAEDVDIEWADGNEEPLRFLVPSQSAHAPAARSVTDCVRNLTYLTAERVGPRETYPLKDRLFTSAVGPRGENTAGLLYSAGGDSVVDCLVREGSPPTLLRQVEARMKLFFDGCEVALEKIPQADAVTLGLRTSKSTDFHRPTHTGFGLTQVLPIVTAALSARTGDLLLIENPEVHLHPAGQVAMGLFLAEVASAGIQVIMETHSDHILNGVRRAAKDGTLQPDYAALHFFRSRSYDKENTLPQVESVILDGEGNIDSWPEGFFDQFDRDMNYFAGWC